MRTGDRLENKWATSISVTVVDRRRLFAREDGLAHGRSATVSSRLPSLVLTVPGQAERDVAALSLLWRVLAGPPLHGLPTDRPRSG